VLKANSAASHDHVQSGTKVRKSTTWTIRIRDILWFSSLSLPVCVSVFYFSKKCSKFLCADVLQMSTSKARSMLF
jgi:hypothetical protein